MLKLRIKSKTASVLALSALIAAAALVRAPMFYTEIGGTASPKILWYDEAYSVFFAGRGPLDAIRLAANDTTPALFVVLLSFWIKLFGSGVWAMSLLPFIFSLAAVPLIYLVGREIGGPRTGFAAALLLAADPLHVRYATELRAYSLLAVISIASLLFLLRYLKAFEMKHAAAWAATLLAGLYCHFTFVALALPEFVFAALAAYAASRNNFRQLRHLALGVAAGLLPQIVMFGRWGDFFGGAAASNLVRGYGHGNMVVFLDYFSVLFLGQGMFYPENFIEALFAAASGLAILVGIAIYLFRGRRSQAERTLAFIVCSGILVLMAAKMIYSPRYYTALLPPMLLLAAAAISRLRRPLFYPAVAAAVLLSAWFLPATYAVPPSQQFLYYAPEFARLIGAEAEKGDLVLADHYSEILFRRYPIAKAEVELFFPRDGRNVTDIYERFRTFDYDFISERDLPTLASLTAGHDRIWTIDYDPPASSLQDPSGFKKKWFDGHFMLIDSKYFPETGPQRVRLSLYERI